MNTKTFLGVAIAAIVAAPLAFAAAPAPAPASPPAATPAPSAGAGAGATTTTTFTLVAADQTKLKDWITQQKTASVAAPAGFTVAVGATLPASIMLNMIPASAGVTAVGTHQYAVIDNKIVLVDPTSRKIDLILA